MGHISNYARVLKAKLQDVFVIDSTDSNVTTTKSVTVEQIGDAICGEQVHADLETDDQTIIGGINENKDKVGDLSQLTTTDKSSLVGAVNEVNSNTKPVYLSTITTGANISFSSNTSYRVGNLVVLNCILKVTGNLANNATILSNIPKNDVNAPIRFLRVVGSDVYYGHDDNVGGFNIDANATSLTMFGALTASSSSPKYLFVNITYICSNA